MNGQNNRRGYSNSNIAHQDNYNYNTTNVNNGYYYNNTMTLNNYYNLGYYNNNYYSNQPQNNNANYGNYSNYYVNPYQQQNNVYPNYGEYTNTNYNGQNYFYQNNEMQNQQQYYSNYANPYQQNNFYQSNNAQQQNTNVNSESELSKLVRETYDQLANKFLKENEKDTIKGPIDIGDKKIYAISDMEGDNGKLFELLEHIQVIEECKSDECDGELILSGDDKGEKKYYKLNYDGIKEFKKNGILVLVGDFVTKRESCGVSTSLLNLISKLNFGLNPKNPDASKQSMFLVLGNHDVKCYEGEGGTDEEGYYLNNGLNNGLINDDYYKAVNRRYLKEYLIDNLNPYLQVVVKNKKNQHVVFQHTGFPYKGENNKIMNKVVDPEKTKKYLNKTYQGRNIDKVIGEDWSNKFKKRGSKYIDSLQGFFDVRIRCDENRKAWFGDIGSKGKKKSDVTKKILAENNSYDDKGVGYDIKVIGHGEIDSRNGQIGDSNSKTSGNVISVTNESYKTKNGMDNFEVLNNLMSEKGEGFAEIRKLNHMPTDINNFAKVSLRKEEIIRQGKKSRWGKQ